MPEKTDITAGDTGGFAAFMAASQHRMIRLAEILTGDRGRAEDLAQHGYAKAYANWRRLENDNPEAYVRRCIVNAHTDWWRRRTWREHPSAALPEQPERQDSASALAERDLVHRALSRLTERERTVVALRFYLDLSEAQIADELGIKPGTVKSTTSRALAKLRTDADLKAEAIS